MAPIPRPSLHRALLAAMCPALAAASWGTCSGNSLRCMTVDRKACTSSNGGTEWNDRTYQSVTIQCQWFDYTGLIVGLAVMGALIVLLGILLFLAWRRMGAMGEHIEKLGAAFGDLDPNEDGASPENPLLQP
ncbi:hypothetical protein ACHAWF_018288, partial [Thalassiosira exigua]